MLWKSGVALSGRPEFGPFFVADGDGFAVGIDADSGDGAMSGDLMIAEAMDFEGPGDGRRADLGDGDQDLDGVTGKQWVVVFAGGAHTGPASL